MPQDQLTKEDEESAARLRAAGLVSLAGLLGIPVAEAGRKQFVGNKILKMMEEGRLGKDLLRSESGKYLQKATVKNKNWNPNAEKSGQPVDLPRGEDGSIPKPTPKPSGEKTGPTGSRIHTNDSPPSTSTPDEAPEVKGENASVSRRTKLAKPKTIKTSALDPAVAKSISQLVQQEIERLKGVAGSVTRPVQEALNPTSVDKSVRRYQIKSETAAGLEAGRPVTAESVKAKEAAQKRARAARQAARAPQANTTQAWNDLVAAKSNIVPMNVFSQEVQDALTQRLPALSAERRRLTTELHKLQTSIGPKPKGGRTKAARQAVSDWNAKNAQIEALTKQIQNYDAVLTPTWSPRPATSQLVNNPGFIMDTYPSMRGAETAGVSLPGLDEYNRAKSEYDKSLFWSGRAGQDVNAAQLADSALSVTPKYSQPMGLSENAIPRPIFGPVMGDDNLEWMRMPIKVPGQEFDPGRDPYSSFGQVQGPGRSGQPISAGPFKNPGPSTVRVEDVIDPTGMQSMLDQYNQQVESLRPDYSKERTAQHVGRIMSSAAQAKATRPDDKSLIQRVVDLLTPGKISESLASNIGGNAATKASNAVAEKRFRKKFDTMPDMSSPDDVARLTDLGWKDPSQRNQGSLISNAANTATSAVKDIGEIKVPRTRLGMNAAAADAGRVLGLKGTQTWNPDLKVGDVNLGKLNRWATGGSLLSGASMVGYNYLRGKEAEKDAAAAAGAKANVKPPTQATAPDKLEEWAIKGWNMIAGKKGNKYQTGQDVYNAVVSEAEGRGYLKGMSDDNKKKVKSLWMTYAKQRDGGK